MNITPLNNTNSQTFNAKFKIQRTKAYKPAMDWFEGQWLKEKEEEWVRKAWGIGTPRDTITIKLGRNNTGKEWNTKQTMTATSKVNGIKITNTDLSFSYNRPEYSCSGDYCYHFEDSVEEYLNFIKRVANSIISKK